jgi:hypothetical protein
MVHGRLKMSEFVLVDQGIGYTIETDDSPDGSSPMEYTSKNEYCFDLFADRKGINQFKNHEAMLDYAAEHNMFVFAVRVYRHSGDSYYLVRENWDNKVASPFPPVDTVVLPYPFNDQWDSAWGGYMLVGALTVLGKDTAKKKELFTTLLDPAMREKAFEMGKDLLDKEQQYQGGEVYGFKVFDQADPDEELDACWGIVGEEDAVAEAVAAAKHQVIIKKLQRHHALNQEGYYMICPNCNGYGSSMKEEAETCTRCTGSGLVCDKCGNEVEHDVIRAEPHAMCPACRGDIDTDGSPYVEALSSSVAAAPKAPEAPVIPTPFQFTFTPRAH